MEGQFAFLKKNDICYFVPKNDAGVNGLSPTKGAIEGGRGKVEDWCGLLGQVSSVPDCRWVLFHSTAHAYAPPGDQVLPGRLRGT